jgi:membrane protease YdiL (CAAX protease family)
MDSGRQLTWLGGIVGAAVLIGTLVGPAVAFGLSQLPRDVSVAGVEMDLPGYVARKGYPSVLSRVIMVLAVAGVIVFHRRLVPSGVGRVGLGNIGLSAPAGAAAADFAAGAVIGLMVLGALLAVKFCVGEFVWSPDPADELALRLVKAGVGCLLIAVIEEVGFRGLLLGGLRRELGTAAGVVACNVVFAGAHCLRQVKRRDMVVDGPWDVAASWECVAEFLGGSAAAPVETAMTFVSLFLFGLLTTYAAMRRGHLYLAMGLHAATAFFVQVNPSVRDVSPAFDSERWFWLLGGTSIKPGLIVPIAMLVAGVLTAAWCRLRPAPTPADAPAGGKPEFDAARPPA